MGDLSITIDYVTLAIVGAILGAAAGLLGWLARAYFKRVAGDKAELIDLIKQSDKRRAGDKAELIALHKDSDKRRAGDKAELIALLKDSDKRSSENFQATNGQFEKLDGKIDLSRKELDKKGEKDHRETREALQKLNRKVEKRHRETLNTLINLTFQGGPHGGPWRVKDDSAARLGQRSPRGNDEPSSARDVEADPEQDALRNDISMVPVAGIGTEPAHAPGLAHQAAPGPKQAPQRADKTGTEPDAEESAATAP